jgi:gliding motility-associated lipoprotein GldH
MHKKYSWLSKFFLGVWVICLISCDKQTVFNENRDFPNAKWAIDNECKFGFLIDDPNLAYNVYYNVRNNLTYPYYNLFVTRYLYDGSGKKLDEKLDELLLADDKTGKPIGNGLGDIYDHKILILKGYKFPKKGAYQIRIKQFMRQNPLPDVLSFGLVVEKAE